MFSCTTPKYDLLYARWLHSGEGASDLLKLAGMSPGDSVLDLCGGTGYQSLCARSLGASDVVLFDLNPRVTNNSVRQIAGDVNKGGLSQLKSLHMRFDVIACRQALGYLKLEQLATGVPPLLRPGGRFVFNTFKQPRWSIQHYRYEGHHYVEASAHLFKTVFHLQSMIGAADVTKFHWHTRRDIAEALRPHFADMIVSETSKSLRFVFIGK